MTEDRDFKDLVRRRAAKTGESYQAARRQLEGSRETGFSARIEAMFRTPSGLAFGCIAERGTVSAGMHVTVTGDGVSHDAVVVSLRRSLWDVEAVTADESVNPQFGMIVDPPYDGRLPARVTG